MAIKICLDAGHYGKYNQSPAVKAYWESEMTWKLHLKLKAELESYGFTVITTRSNQATDLSLISRGKKAKGCDLFLSLHSNAVGSRVDENVDHIVIMRLIDDNTTNIDEKSKALAEKLAPVITKVMGVKQKEYRIPANKSSNDRNGDGILNDNYYGVLHGCRQVNVAGLILEHSFHTNTRSTEWLMVDSNLDKLAKEEAKVIAEFFNMKKKTDVPKTDNTDNTPKTENTTNKKKVEYKVQAGAYELKSGAEKMLSKLKAAGYNGFVKKVGKYYKIQVGSFSIKKNAEKLVADLKKKGFSAFVYEEVV